jgi:hypothetical protein
MYATARFWSLVPLNGGPAVMLITTDVAKTNFRVENECAKKKDIGNFCELTDITKVAPTSGNQDAKAETVWNPEELLHAPCEQQSQHLVNHSNKKQGAYT